MTDQPGFTQIQNSLLELLALLPEAEGRVMAAVARKTAGWRKECDVISYSQLEDATRMSRQGVINGIEAAINRGILIRTATGKNNGFCYEVNYSQVVNQVDHLKQSTKLTSQRSRPEVVNEVDHQVVNEVDPQKKDSKEKKEKGVRAPRATPAPRKTDVVFEALAGVCGIDWHVCTKEQRDQLNQSTGLIRKAGGKAGKSDEEVAETVRYVAGYFRRMDWRGKRGETPTPAQIREVWGAAIQERDKNRATVIEQPETPATPKPIRISAAERAARIAAARQNEGTR